MSEYSFHSPRISRVDGIPFVVTEHAMTMPDGEPRTDDMRQMIDHMKDLGLIRAKPGCFVTTDHVGRKTIHMHPHFQSALANRMAKEMDRQFDRILFGEQP